MTDGTGPDEHDDAPPKVPVTDATATSDAVGEELPPSTGTDEVATEQDVAEVAPGEEPAASSVEDSATPERADDESGDTDPDDVTGAQEPPADESADAVSVTAASYAAGVETTDVEESPEPEPERADAQPAATEVPAAVVPSTQAHSAPSAEPEAPAGKVAEATEADAPAADVREPEAPSAEVPDAKVPESKVPDAEVREPETTAAVEVPAPTPAAESSQAARGGPVDADEPVAAPSRPDSDAMSWAPLVAARRARELEEQGAPAPEPGGATTVLPPVTAAPATPVLPPTTAAAPAAPLPPVTAAPPAAPPSADPVVPVPVADSPLAPPAPVVSVAPAPATAGSSQAPAGSPLDVFEEQEPRPRRWVRRVLVTAGVIIVLGGVYVGASYAVADKVPRGATVAGVDIGGLSSQAAVDRLTQELADTSTEPVPVVANDVQAQVDPATAGLTFDAQATVDELTGVDLAHPVRLWEHLVGVGAQEPVTHVDVDALTESIQSLTTSLALAPVDGAIVFADGAPHATDAVDGWEVDVEGAAEAVQGGWLTAERPLSLPTVVVEPAVTQEATEAALVSARDVTSAPVGVTVSDRLATLSPEVLAAAATYAPQDGELVLTMDGPMLVQSVLEQLPDLLTEAADAHFEFQNDAPVIVPGTPGTTLDPQVVATSVADAVHASVRTAAVELVESDPAESTAELEALGITEIVSEFSTPLTSEPRRTTNIANGASKISGTLVRPDETFSLTEALGPIDADHGFVEAGAIVSGEHVDAWGGGLSQISTTTYNAAYFAGFEDIEHKPHSEWFSRYPEGREATLFTGTLDMQWKNDTPYGALVQAWVADGRVYVRIWGTKYWTVESETSGRSGVVAPTTVYSQSPTCEPSSAGNPGFTVTVTRKRYLNGTLDETDSNTWRYKPQNKVICGPAPTEPAATP